MARYSYESSVYCDHRFQQLQIKLGCFFKADYAYHQGLRLAQDHYLDESHDRLIPAEALADLLFPDELVSSGVLTWRQKGYYFLNSEALFKWKIQLSEAGSKPRLRASRSKEAPELNKSSTFNGRYRPITADSGRQRPTATTTNTSTSIKDLDLDLSLKEEPKKKKSSTTTTFFNNELRVTEHNNMGADTAPHYESFPPLANSLPSVQDPRPPQTSPNFTDVIPTENFEEFSQAIGKPVFDRLQREFGTSGFVPWAVTECFRYWSSGAGDNRPNPPHLRCEWLKKINNHLGDIRTRLRFDEQAYALGSAPLRMTEADKEREWDEIQKANGRFTQPQAVLG